MALLAYVADFLKGFAAFWALVTFAVAASFLSQMDDDFGAGAVDNSNFAATGAIIAFGVLAFLWFLTYLAVLLFVSSANILLALLVEIPVLAFLFILGLGSVAALSTETHWFNRFSQYTAAQLGNATLGVGWILVFLILGIIILQLVVIFRHPRTHATWRASFHDLASGTVPAAVPGATTDAEKGQAAPAVPNAQEPFAATASPVTTGLATVPSVADTPHTTA
ncbi:hypothetical protein Q5752_002580 [Cryptotrichosporon argae]